MVADALSRRHGEIETSTGEGSCLAVSTVRPNSIEELQKSYETDTYYQELMAQLQLDPNSQGPYSLADGLLK